MADKRTFGDRKYDKRVLYKPSPESKEMVEKYVAPAVLAGMSLIPVGGGAVGAMSRLSKIRRAAPAVAKAEKVSQSGARRYSDVNRADKVTKMKDRKGVERRDPMEPRATSSSEKGSQSGVRRYSAVDSANKTTRMKDRKGVERKEQRPAGRSIIPPVRGGGPVKRQGSSAPSMASTVQSTKGAELSSMYMRNPTQRPYDASTSPRGGGPEKRQGSSAPSMAKAPIPKAKPASLKKKAEKRKPEKKSKTRIAFEKEFAAARKKGKKSFSSKLGKYGKYSTKLK